MRNYDDLIYLCHYEPKFHPRMSMESRAAQFAPFAALVGYSDAVKETARLTENKIEISDQLRDQLNLKLKILQEHINEQPSVTVTYFVPDKKKSGGKYESFTCAVKQIDNVDKVIIFTNKYKVHLDEIIDLTSNEIKFLDNLYY